MLDTVAPVSRAGPPASRRLDAPDGDFYAPSSSPTTATTPIRELSTSRVADEDTVDSLRHDLQGRLLRLANRVFPMPPRIQTGNVPT